MRVEAADELVRQVAKKNITCPADLAGLKTQLIALASVKGLWGEARYQAPDGPDRQRRFLVSQDHEDGVSLYLNIMRAGHRVSPHNHTTWACIAGVEGVEENYLYDRLEGGNEPGPAKIAQVDKVSVGPGQAIALMPDDIHHVEIEGGETIRHLHLYGRPLENLTRRLLFDPQAQTCRIMTMAVKTQPKDVEA